MGKKQTEPVEINAENIPMEETPVPASTPEQVLADRDKSNGKETESKPNPEKKKKIYALIKVIEKVLLKIYEFRRNEVTMQTECRLKGTTLWEIADIDSIYRYLLHSGFDSYNLMQDLKSLLRSDFVKKFNPFTGYFSSLPKWDGKTNHIKKLASYIITEDQAFFETMLTKFMVSSIRCSLDGIPNRTVLTFYSFKQNIGKSWLLRFMNPFGKDYYSESPIRDNKDTYIRLSENFWINFEELADLTYFEVNRLKAIISSKWVKERRPYAPDEVVMPRRCNFVASTNRPEFLVDTQNTRWCIIKVVEINQAYSKEFNIHDAWMQAYSLYLDKNFDCELTKAEQDKRDNINREFEVSSAEHEAVLRYLTPCKKEEGEFYTLSEIMDYLVEQTVITYSSTAGLRDIVNPVKLFSKGVTNALVREGFIRDKKYINRKQCRGYYAIKVLSPKVTDSQQGMAFDEVDEAVKQSSADTSLDDAYKLL